MADFGVGEAIMLGSAVAGAGASVYAASQAGKVPNVPKPPADPNTPKAPATAPLAASMEQGEIAAKTAGGTLLSKPGVGDAANSTRKSLLGM